MSSNIKSVHRILRRVSEAVVLYAALSYMLGLENQFELGLIAFAILWVASDLAIWFYRYIVVPSAKAIDSAK